MINYEFILYDQNGNQIQTLNPSFVTLARSEMNIGELQMGLPSWDLYKSIRAEYRIGVFRSVDNGLPRLVGNTYWIINRIKRQRKSRVKTLVLLANDLNILFDRKIIPYAAGNAGSTKNKAADNMQKEIMRENYLSGTRSIASVFSVDTDSSKCPSVSLAFDYAKVLPTLQAISNASYQSGTYLSFDIVPNSANSFTFFTFTNQRGQDRRYTATASPVIIYDDLNIEDLEITDDYSQMATSIYARGQGESIATASDSSRVFSTIGAIEKLVSAGNATSSQIQTEANQGLKKYKPKKIFTGNFVPSESMQFERDIFFGDYITAQVETEKIDVRITAFKLDWVKGEEDITLALRSDI